jgi:Excalibur calcium-binding domain
MRRCSWAASRACALAIVGALAAAPAASAAKHFPNCAHVNAVHKHGIAKNAKRAKLASGLTGRPFVNLSLYLANRGLDRDHDGVACEK